MTTSLRPTDRPVGDDAVPPFLRMTAGYVWRIGLLVIAVYVLFIALARVETVAIAVFVALVASAILLPLTRLLSSWMPRGLAAALSVVLAFLLVASVFA